MIQVKILQKCNNCNNLSKINKVFVQEVEEETLFCKEYLCEDCGKTFFFLEVIDFVINKEQI